MTEYRFGIKKQVAGVGIEPTHGSGYQPTSATSNLMMVGATLDSLPSLNRFVWVAVIQLHSFDNLIDHVVENRLFHGGDFVLKVLREHHPPPDDVFQKASQTVFANVHSSAQDRSRTCTLERGLDSESSVATSYTTWAYFQIKHISHTSK